MGISSDGILAYGVDLGEPDEVEVPWGSGEDEDRDFEAWVKKLAGASTDHLWESYEPFLQEHPKLKNATHQERMAAWEAANPGLREALDAGYVRGREALASCPIDVVSHCSFDYPMEIVAVRGYVFRASRGCSKLIPSLMVDEEKIVAARKFCAEHAIPLVNPQWILASMYG